jgi:hypothetical protein
MLLDWDNDTTVFMQSENSTSAINITIALIVDELVLAIAVPKGYTGTLSKMCGDNDGQILDDANLGRKLINGTYVPVTQAELESKLLTAEYLSEAYKDVYSADATHTFVKTDDSYSLEATAAGTMLKLNGDQVQCSAVNVGPFTEFTLTGKINLNLLVTLFFFID